MGYYINPLNETKEEFVAQHAREVSHGTFSNFNFDTENNFLPICLIDNGPFRALGIAYSRNELAEFGSLKDYRPKRYFFVSIETLKRPESGADLGFLK